MGFHIFWLEVLGKSPSQVCSELNIEGKDQLSPFTKGAHLLIKEFFALSQHLIDMGKSVLATLYVNTVPVWLA